MISLYTVVILPFDSIFASSASLSLRNSDSFSIGDRVMAMRPERMN
jgi:hypothetical protein